MSSERYTADEVIDAYQIALIITGADLDEECRHQDSQHSHIADEHALAASRYAEAKLGLKPQYAEASARQREILVDKSGSKRPTVAEVEAAAYLDEEYARYCGKLSEFKRLELRWEALREASRGRGFSLRLVTDREIAGLVSYGAAAPTRRAKQMIEGRSGSAYDQPAESGSEDRARL